MEINKLKRKLRKAIDDIADKTDIWDNERWNKFRRLLRTELDEIVEDYAE